MMTFTETSDLITACNTLGIELKEGDDHALIMCYNRNHIVINYSDHMYSEAKAYIRGIMHGRAKT